MDQLNSPELNFRGGVDRRYSFSGFTLDLDRRLLQRGAEEIALRPKSFDVLAYLVRHAGQLVTKSSLIEGVWPDTAVTDNSLAQCIVEVRRALDDNSQQLIRTVARRGYVFEVPLSSPVNEFPGKPELEAEAHTAPAAIVKRSRNLRPWPPWRVSALGLLVLVLGGVIVFQQTHPADRQMSYTQITNFTDSAVAPALSPDGRMVAFLRSNLWFLSRDQIYVKILPDGEPVQLTHDARQKYGISFTPDGSRITYTAVDSPQFGWNTYTIPVLGGVPTLLLSNASGLTWLHSDRILFAEQDGWGIHMGIVTARANRSDSKKIYFPPHQRSMAHFAYASPDGKWALVIEMNPAWQPCRVIPLDGSSAGWQVGPKGNCMSAAWSPDGKWMYFGADVEGARHLYRQPFPRGNAEQITFGASDEGGLAMAPDGRSLITSVGLERRTVWIHDLEGERPLHSEGSLEGMHVALLSSVLFSPDSKSIFYLLRRDSPRSASELWRTDLLSGKNEAVLRGQSILEYNLSEDGKEAVFSTQASEKARSIWLAPLDRSSSPKLITADGGAWPTFGPNGRVLFLWSDGKANYLVRVGRDGSGKSKLVPYPLGNLQAISPDRRWIAAHTPAPNAERGVAGTVAFGTLDGDARPICAGYCFVRWAPDGRYVYLGLAGASLDNPGKTVAIPIPQGKSLPELPAHGIVGLKDAQALPGARIIDGFDISPSSDPFVYAYTKAVVHRNLYRITLP